jgi:CBS domain-containing protein
MTSVEQRDAGGLKAPQPTPTILHWFDLVKRIYVLAAETGRVPIVDPASGKLVGLIARKDLLRLRSAPQSSEQDRRPYLGAQSASETTTE